MNLVHEPEEVSRLPGAVADPSVFTRDVTGSLRGGVHGPVGSGVPSRSTMQSGKSLRWDTVRNMCRVHTSEGLGELGYRGAPVIIIKVRSKRLLFDFQVSSPQGTGPSLSSLPPSPYSCKVRLRCPILRRTGGLPDRGTENVYGHDHEEQGSNRRGWAAIPRSDPCPQTIKLRVGRGGDTDVRGRSGSDHRPVNPGLGRRRWVGGLLEGRNPWYLPLHCTESPDRSLCDQGQGRDVPD